jgi:hypothetical protein
VIAIAAPRLELDRLVLPIAGVRFACAGGELLAPVIQGASWSDFHGRAAEVALREVQVPARTTAAVRELRAAGFEVRVSGGVWEIAAARLELAGLRLETLLGAEQASGPPGLGFLDAIDGELDFAVAVDVRVPVLGRVGATHTFHVPIQGGTVDVRALEHALPPLADALLDFVLRDDRLVLQRNVPARAADRELVSWPLDAEGVALAREGRVRLRTLPFPARRTADRARAGEGAVAVRGVDIAIARADLRLAAPATVELGGRVRLRLGDGPTAIAARGVVRHRPDGPRLSIELQLSLG